MTYNLAPERLEEILGAISEGVIYQEADGKIKFFNQTAQRIFGIGAEQALGRTSMEPDWHLIHEDGLPCPGPEHPSMITLRTGQALSDQIRGIAKPDRPVVWLSINTIPIFSCGQERPDGVVISFSDITERKRAEEDFKRFFDLTPDLACIASTSGYFLKLNPAWRTALGFNEEELLSAPLLDFIHPDDRAPTMAEMERQLGGGETIDFVNRYRCKDGSYKWLEWRATPAVDQTLLFASARDITERKRTEELRQEGFDLLNNLARLVPGVIYQYRLFPDGRSAFPYSSPGMYDIYEVTPEEVRDDASVVFGRIHPEDHDRVAEAIFESARTLNTFQCELRVILPEKGLGWRWSQAHPERTEDGGTLWHGIILDITELKQAEQALREQEERLRAIFDSSQDIIYLKDADLRYTHCNAAMERLFGIGLKEIIGHTDADFFQEDDAKEIAAVDRRVLESHASHSTFTRTLGGEKRIIDTSKAPVFDSAGNVVGLCGVSRDITEEVNLREQMRQAQKVEAIGRLAGGVAHDLNNLLSPILGYGEILLDDLPPGDARREDVHQIMRAGMRARDIVRQLLAFSRKQVLDFKAVDINTAIREFEKLLRRTIPEDIRLETILTPDTLPVMADVGQIEQILMNLAVNAADAMPNGGKLTIETTSVELDEAYAATRPDVQPGTYTMMAVSDTGCGMDEETSNKIFEPFFSTKGKQGTGLGLATVFGIAKQHGGNIWLYSEPGKGTTFKIYLPIAEKMLLEGQPSKKQSADLKGTETILLVEDNEQVRELAYAILKRQGYTVLMAVNGEAALKSLAKHNGPVHLLLTDVVMPGMNGRVLYEKASQQHPEMKALYMSGYTDNVIAHRGVLDQGVQFIQKPFSVKSLAAKVREVLDHD